MKIHPYLPVIFVCLCPSAYGFFWKSGGRNGLPVRMIANETLINAKTGGSFIVGINCTVINPHLETTSLGGRGGDGMGGAGLTERQAGPLDKNPITQLIRELSASFQGVLAEILVVYGARALLMATSKLMKMRFNRSPVIRFSDVIGCNIAKDEVLQLVDFLHDPGKYRRIGANIPKGVLLVGPPGVGKTLLAKALAGEAGVPFFYMSGAEFSDVYWGMGVKKIKSLFALARSKRKSIIFIDEFDAVARRRMGGMGSAALMDAENTLNQLLTEMDGFESKDNVVVIASTNRPEVLDKAALRPGRFDRKIFVDPPEVGGREELFKRYLSKLKVEKDPEVLSKWLAKMTPGYVGAQIANLCNEAALRAAKLNHTELLESDLSWAADRCAFGLEKEAKISPEDLKLTAVHEAGHAVVAYSLPRTAKPVKVSVIARGGMGGYNLIGDTKNGYHTEGKLREDIAVLMGGRAAEEVVLGEVSHGSSNDLEKATEIAETMVKCLGWGKKTGLMAVGTERGEDRELSGATLRMFEEEIQAILSEEYIRAKIIIKKHREGLNKLVALLIEKEVAHEEELSTLLGMVTA